MMNDRLQISANVPADRAEVMSDQARLDDLADYIESQNEAAAKANVRTFLGQEACWSLLLDDEIPTFLDVPLADCMANLDAAIDGNEVAKFRIFQALHQIQRHALPLAEKALKQIYDEEGL
jgi:hypothetical protein